MSGALREKGLYIGLMSGTSLDGVDAALVDCGGETPQLMGTAHHPYPASLRAAALAIQESANASLTATQTLHQQLAELYADVALALLGSAKVEAEAVRAIGCHGQTIAHRPTNPHGYSLQLGNGARIAARTGITTVTDFRNADIARGGQGAPLAPLFHALAFGHLSEPRVVLNLGGIANITRLGPDKTLLGGFDTGPANALMDGWMQSRTNTPYDPEGRCAQTGTVLPTLLDALLQHPFLALTPPKSTGREDFNLRWLESVIAQTGCETAAVQDVQATLAQFTAASVANAIVRHAPDTKTVIVCGGGAYNADLLERLRRCLPGSSVRLSDAYGLAPQWIEAVAFAWLAAQCVQRIPMDLRNITGAREPAVLGCIYPA